MFKKYFSSPHTTSSFPVALVEQEISCTKYFNQKKKNGRAKWGGKFLEYQKVRARANQWCAKPHTPQHITSVMCHGTERVGTSRMPFFYWWRHNQLFVPPNSIRGMWRYGEEKLYQIWVPLNTADYFKWMNYWISDSACFLLTRRQLIPKRKGEELSFCEMVGEWKGLGCALFWHCFRRETEIP